MVAINQDLKSRIKEQKEGNKNNRKIQLRPINNSTFAT